MSTLASTIRRFLQASVIAFVGACLAQSPAPGAHVAIKGYDPVAYFTQNKAVKGTPDISYDFDDARYQFSSADHKKAFSQNPDKYAPQFTGFCSTGLAMGHRVESNPEFFLIADGKLYTFSTAQARDMAKADPNLLVEAEKNWRAKK